MKTARIVLGAGAGLLAFALPAGAQKGPVQSSTGLPREVVSLACAPRLAYEMPAVPLRVSGGQDQIARVTFAPGDLITINAGTRDGIAVGQEFYTRRPLLLEHEHVDRNHPTTIRTTGWVRVWAVDEDMSLATISHACETVNINDYLEPFTPPVVPLPLPNAGPAQRENYGRVMIGQDRRTAFAQGDYLIVNRGIDHGVIPGARFVVYHDNHAPGNFLFQVGEAVAVDVKGDSSTLQVMSAIDAILEGDYVAMRK